MFWNPASPLSKAHPTPCRLGLDRLRDWQTDTPPGAGKANVVQMYTLYSLYTITNETLLDVTLIHLLMMAETAEGEGWSKEMLIHWYWLKNKDTNTYILTKSSQFLWTFHYKYLYNSIKSPKDQFCLFIFPLLEFWQLFMTICLWWELDHH